MKVDWEVMDRSIGMPEGTTYSLWVIDDNRLVLGLDEPDTGVERAEGYVDLVFDRPEPLDELIKLLTHARAALWGTPPTPR